MFGLIDQLLLPLNVASKELVKKPAELVSGDFYHGGKTLVCFLPEIILSERILGQKILNSAESVLIYKLRPSEIVRPNPSHTRESLQEVYEDSLSKVLPLNINPEDLIVFGVSIGNCLAYRFAAQSKARRLISVVPGSKLSEAIWASTATQRQIREAKKLGFRIEDFKRELSQFDPINYISEISGFVEVYIGKYDKMIPYSLGKELALSLERESEVRKDLTVRINTDNFGDHSSTAYFFTREFVKRRF